MPQATSLPATAREKRAFAAAASIRVNSPMTIATIATPQTVRTGWYWMRLLTCLKKPEKGSAPSRENAQLFRLALCQIEIHLGILRLAGCCDQLFI